MNNFVEIAGSSFVASVVLRGSPQNEYEYPIQFQQFMLNTVGEGVAVLLTSQVSIPSIVHRYFLTSMAIDLVALTILHDSNDPETYKSTFNVLCCFTCCVWLASEIVSKIRERRSFP